MKPHRYFAPLPAAAALGKDSSGHDRYGYGLTLFMGVRALLYPPFVVKTRMQVEKGIKGMSAFQVARETVRGEGVRGLYKGFGISSTTLVFRQFYFTTYEVVRQKLGPQSELYAFLGPETGEMVRNMTAGAASSVVTQFFTVPVDIISQRMVIDSLRSAIGSRQEASKAAAVEAAGPAVEATIATSSEQGALRRAVAGAGVGGETGAEGTSARQRGSGEGGRFVSAQDVAREVYRESGLRGFYRGFGVSVLQFAPTSAIWWTAYGLYSKVFIRALANFNPPQLPAFTGEQRKIGAQAAAGFCTGMTTVVLTNPLDVLRTRLQVEGRRGDKMTILSEYRALIAESGPGGLMRGLVPRMMAMAPASVLILSVYELIKRLSRKVPTSPRASTSSGEMISSPSPSPSR
ncbi:unnamed protein product [Ascophyllum nodosum]